MGGPDVWTHAPPKARSPTAGQRVTPEPTWRSSSSTSPTRARCERLVTRLEPWAVVLNAGYMNIGPVADVPSEDALRQVHPMVVAPRRLATLALPAMRRWGERPPRRPPASGAGTSPAWSFGRRGRPARGSRRPAASGARFGEPPRCVSPRRPRWRRGGPRRPPCSAVPPVPTPRARTASFARVGANNHSEGGGGRRVGGPPIRSGSVMHVPEPVSPGYRSRVREVSPTYRSQCVAQLPGFHTSSAGSDVDSTWTHTSSVLEESQSKMVPDQHFRGGDDRTRTGDPLLAKQVL